MNQRPTPEPKPRRTLFRVLRAALELSLLTFGVFLFSFWLIVHRAEARLESAVEQFWPLASGGELGRAQATSAAFEGTLYLNALPLRIGTRSLPGEPLERLSELQRECRGFFFDAKESKGLGRTALCLRAPNGKSPELAASIQRFAETTDLRELGSPEVHFLRRTERSGQPMTQQLQIRALSLDLASAFPREGDAPGLDPRFAPRPPGRRTLSVQFHETSGSKTDAPPRIREILYAYESPEPPEKFLMAYERALLSAGFRALPTGTRGDSARAFESNAHAFIVMTGPNEKGSWLSLALLPKTADRTATALARNP